jgi:hypothetical protein
MMNLRRIRQGLCNLALGILQITTEKDKRTRYNDKEERIIQVKWKDELDPRVNYFEGILEEFAESLVDYTMLRSQKYEPSKMEYAKVEIQV